MREADGLEVLEEIWEEVGVEIRFLLGRFQDHSPVLDLMSIQSHQEESR